MGIFVSNVLNIGKLRISDLVIDALFYVRRDLFPSRIAFHTLSPPPHPGGLRLPDIPVRPTALSVVL